MTTIKTSRWLLVALAIVGIALVTPLTSAHDTDTTTNDPHLSNGSDALSYDGTTDQWDHRMEDQMTEHVGPGSVEWMESHMGVTIEEMADYMADDDYGHATGGGIHGSDVHYSGDTHDDGVRSNGGGMAGWSHGC